MQDYISVFDLFSIGMGPSSSHSVGPMRAANRFVAALEAERKLEQVKTIEIRLYGSLALTGKGHGTDRALILGLQGLIPESVDPDKVEEIVDQVQQEKSIVLPEGHRIDFDPEQNIRFLRKESLKFHPNGLIFRATDSQESELLKRTYFSVGGGFVIEGDIADARPQDTLASEAVIASKAADANVEGDEPSAPGPVPFPFSSGKQLLQHAADQKWAISRVIWENEKHLRPEKEIRDRILELWQVMQECVERGCQKTGTLPGGLKVERRAAGLYEKLMSQYETKSSDPLTVLDWVDLFALAVNEENAAGGRVVTAPTNGAAGIIPAVLLYHQRFCPGANDDCIVKFFLTAGAIGMLYKMNASISGAEVGCQGEVGVACSMAAGALTEVLGGSPLQVEQAAEIGMEHNLGLTCDPIGGLVQVPCIERNAMGAVKAINAARLALRGDGNHRVSLDKVIRTMRRTGQDMSSKYKETSRGGLAVNFIEC